jgi:hypothetical protein
MATPKRARGVGFTDTREMNKCFLAKWVFKIERGGGSLCCNLLRENYTWVRVDSIAVEIEMVHNFGRDRWK